MAHVFTTCVIIAVLVFIFFALWYQNSTLKPKFKNCLSVEDGTFINVQHVPINDQCPSSTTTCPQYFGCDNTNIPFCRNKDENGDYEGISCPRCENGRWKCDFFMMGNNENGIAAPIGHSQYTCSDDSQQERYNCEFNHCESLGDDCKWGSFNSGGGTSYSDKGTPSKHKVSGYKVSTSGKSPLFNLSFGYDAAEHLKGSVETIDKVSLQRCISEAEQPYSYNQNNFDGSYGFVYDAKNFSCNLHRIGDGVNWEYSTAKLVKG